MKRARISPGINKGYGGWENSCLQTESLQVYYITFFI
ncbi:hypothetical protein YBT020_29016 (plasmid) [Bacillus thuringiensis serovar finitimus YBT-020]|nr:hypothetical protein YBT020_29016 [Bacillus thuringiensis serovar finitimus YBT-020]